MKKLLILLVVLSAASLIATQASADDLLLEPSGNYGEGLQTCDNLHHIGSCDVYHFTKKPPKRLASTFPVSEELGEGSVVYLDDQPYRLQWMGQGYYLENGTILHAREDVNGLEWVEAYPQAGRVHSSARLMDNNLDGLPSISDAVQLSSGSSRIVDVRLNVRVSPVR